MVLPVLPSHLHFREECLRAAMHEVMISTNACSPYINFLFVGCCAMCAAAPIAVMGQWLFCGPQRALVCLSLLLLCIRPAPCEDMTAK